MLIAFSCPTSGQITMFGDVAVRLLKLMGHSATIPGALAAEDVGPALKRLQAAIEADKPSSQSESAAPTEGDEPPVNLAVRAWPLIEMLKTAEKTESHVMWDQTHMI